MDPEAVGMPELIELRIEQIRVNPKNVRETIEQDGVEELAESIRSVGLLNPVTVSPAPDGNGYVLIAGERRFRACVEAGMETVPAIVRDLKQDEQILIGILENVQRQELHPLDEARAYKKLMDEFGWSPTQIAKRVGKSQPYVSNRLRLLKLPEEGLEKLATGEITPSHAMIILQEKDEGRQRVLLEEASRRPVEELERMIGKRGRQTKSEAESEKAVRKKRREANKSDGSPVKEAGPQPGQVVNLSEMLKEVQDPLALEVIEIIRRAGRDIQEAIEELPKEMGPTYYHDLLKAAEETAQIAADALMQVRARRAQVAGGD
ncbi:MAG: chromosome (plasmid) partitioning protein [Phage 5P_2]|jgi:ParB family chromosome partitioning protein|nr:MAG: chromosome (plasmid) partitioning protein [Phage 5P_2]